MTMDEKLSPERAVRLLRAKAAELEAIVLSHANPPDGFPQSVDFLRADIALVAGLLADHIERTSDGVIFVADGGRVKKGTWGAGYLSSILEVTEFDVGSKEESDYVAALKAECDAYLGQRQPWGPNHPDYDEMGQ